MTDEPIKRVSQQLNKPLPPEDDIGPFYKMLAVFLTVAAVILLVINAMSHHTNSWIDVALLGVVAVFVLALIRPKKFDGLVKTIADSLPFLKYRKE